MNITKNTLRTNIKKELCQFFDSEKNKDFLDNNACNIFLNSDLYKKTSIILAYISIKNELSVDKIIKTALLQGKQVAVPKTNVEKQTMTFHLLNNNFPLEKQLKKGNYNILEPLDSLSEFPIKNMQTNTVILTPGLAFSKNGARLGRGKGFYDKFFEQSLFYNPLIYSTFHLVGCCYDIQIKDFIPTEKNDIKVTNIITPSNIIFVKK